MDKENNNQPVRFRDLYRTHIFLRIVRIKNVRRLER